MLALYKPAHFCITIYRTTHRTEHFMNTQERQPIRSIDFNAFEKPRALPHWSFDERLRTRASKRALDLEAVLRALKAKTSQML